MEDPRGTGDRMTRAENAVLDLANVVEDVVRDMETIAINLPDTTKHTHELAQARRGRELVRALRAAVADARHRL
jgi:hypothetical protein